MQDWSRYLFLLLAFMLCSSAEGQSLSKTSSSPRVKILDDRKIKLKEVGSLPTNVKEASGIENTGDLFWVHNDDGIPALYCLDSVGHLLRAVQFNVSNRGWEDLTQDEDGNFYIGGFGNNNNDKQDLKIYKVSTPDKITAAITQPEIIKYRYSDQTKFPPAEANKNFDVDAFFAWKGYLFLFTKDRSVPFTGYSKIYRLKQTGSEQTAELVDSLFVGQGPMINNWITSVDISPDKKTIALLFHDKIWLLRGFSEQNFSRSTAHQLNLNHYSHKAGICFITNERIQIVDELEFGLLGGKLYSLDIMPVISELKP